MSKKNVTNNFQHWKHVQCTNHSTGIYATLMKTSVIFTFFFLKNLKTNEAETSTGNHITYIFIHSVSRDSCHVQKLDLQNVMGISKHKLAFKTEQ